MTTAHRHTNPGQHEYDVEPQPGLPEALPEGETLLWQGAPSWKDLCVDLFKIRALGIYFALMVVARMGAVASDGSDITTILMSGVYLLPFIAMALAGLVWLAWMTAQNALYTITSHRIVMRIGIALTLTFNLPLKRIVSADLVARANGSGDIVLTFGPDDKIAWVHLWPHAKSWKIGHPKPVLRCVQDVKATGKILTDAWQQKSDVSHRSEMQKPAQTPDASNNVVTA